MKVAAETAERSRSVACWALKRAGSLGRAYLDMSRGGGPGLGRFGFLLRPPVKERGGVFLTSCQVVGEGMGIKIGGERSHVSFVGFEGERLWASLVDWCRDLDWIDRQTVKRAVPGCFGGGCTGCATEGKMINEMRWS